MDISACGAHGRSPSQPGAEAVHVPRTQANGSDADASGGAVCCPLFGSEGQREGAPAGSAPAPRRYVQQCCSAGPGWKGCFMSDTKPVTPDPVPADYRHLDTDGYTSYDVSPWAEQRQCVFTGGWGFGFGACPRLRLLDGFPDSQLSIQSVLLPFAARCRSRASDHPRPVITRVLSCRELLPVYKEAIQGR